ncbi:HAMP domain-containing sensor histidine kinase [Sulfurimonas sp. HSL1-2]|uniref:HAMP domain-containing sensor histidine kinase n=1 Tax=Thiomicrolovo zhangzhouensis TaxID=3131933 RepID=UPI0031F9E6B6
MKRPKSLQQLVISFFLLSSIVTFSLLGSYVVYRYHAELKSNLRLSLKVLAEDVVRHRLYANDASSIRQNFHLIEAYHSAPFVALFDDLTFDIGDSMPSAEEVSIIAVLPDGRYLKVHSNTLRIEQKTRDLALHLAAVFGAILLLFVLVFSLFLTRLLHPLRCLVRYCRMSAVDEQESPVCSGSAEVNELKNAIIDLQHANRSLCREKQNIFKEAAHEIKAPIAVLKARLSLFSEDDTYPKMRFVGESEADIATISSKLKELIFLKEIEWDMREAREDVPMQEQCRAMQQAFQPILEKKGLTMVSNFEQDFTLRIHKAAMQKVMQAVFENIFMHTKNHSVIRTTVDPARRRLEIVNEVGSKSDETLFSSHIGSRMIDRLSDKLGYRYETRLHNGTFTTVITFDAQEEQCPLERG